MGRYDLLRAPQFLAQPGNLLLHCQHAARLSFRQIRFGAALVRARYHFLQRRDLLAPLAKMRAVQPFTAQQRSHLTGLVTGVRGAYHAAFVAHRKAPAFGYRNHLRVGARRRAGDCLSSRPPGSFRGSPRHQTNINIKQSFNLQIHDSHLSLYTNLTEKDVSRQSDTGGNGAWSVTNLPAGTTYKACEVTPSTSWNQTDPMSGDSGTTNGGPAGACYFGAVETANVTGLDFGNVLLGGGGAYTLGYWSNKNGQALLKKYYGNADGLPPGLVCDKTSALQLANATGSLVTFKYGGYTSFRTWLLGATAQNMAYMLSAQMASMQLNACVAGVSRDAWVYAGLPVHAGCTDPDYGPILGAGDYTVAGFMQVGTLIARSEYAVTHFPLTTAAANLAVRGCQEYLKNALDSGNNNLNFVQLPVTNIVPSPY